MSAMAMFRQLSRRIDQSCGKKINSMKDKGWPLG